MHAHTHTHTVYVLYVHTGMQGLLKEFLDLLNETQYIPHKLN
jgi:hypothetical protein